MVFYKVEYWDEFDSNIVNEQGAVFGEFDIIKNLQDYYGKDNICEVTLKWTEDSDYEIVTEEMLQKAFEE